MVKEGGGRSYIMIQEENSTKYIVYIMMHMISMRKQGCCALDNKRPSSNHWKISKSVNINLKNTCYCCTVKACTTTTNQPSQSECTLLILTTADHQSQIRLHANLPTFK